MASPSAAILAALQKNDGAQALRLARSWVSREKSSAEGQYWLAIAHLSLGQAGEAIPLLQSAAHHLPRHVDVWNNLGVALRQVGRWPEAEAAFLRAQQIQPRHAESLLSLGQLRLQRGDSAEALATLVTAWQLAPQFPEAWTSLAEALVAQQRAEEALSLLQKGEAAFPRSADLPHQRGLLLQRLGRTAEAEAPLRLAVERQPQQALSQSHLAAVLLALDRPEAALPPAEQAARLAPADPGVLNNLALVLLRLHRAPEARELLRRALARQPGDAEVAHNLANADHELGDTPAAIARLQDLQQTHPGFSSASFNLSCMLLGEGRFAEGWALYPHRYCGWRERFSSPPCSDPEALTGRSLCLHAEQGLGDTLHFARYARLLAERGARVVFEVQPLLLPVLRSTHPGVTVVGRGPTPPPTELHLPLLSAPQLLGTDLASIPPLDGSVHAPVERLAPWAAWLGPRTRPRLGVVWSGNPAHRNDHHRSLPLEQVAATLANLPIDWVILQKEVRPSDAPTLARLTAWRQPGPDWRDFGDTAALLTHLDGLVTVDTSVAHLAACLGRPTWLLLPEPPDWRWLRERSDSPWYPSIRLVRCKRSGDWPSALTQLQTSLASPAEFPQA